MTPSDKSFQLKIKREFLNKKNKNGLFWTLRTQLRAFLRYPDDYIMYFLEMLSEPMPLHAAVSADYFRQRGCIPDRMPVFMAELHDKCEQNFIREAESLEPDLQKCADLHIAFSYLNPESVGTIIPEAVEKLSEDQRKTLFQEVGRCIHTVYERELEGKQEESDLLDPVLKYFSLRYPEELNGIFLEQNQEQFRSMKPEDTTLSELFINAVKKQYFHYFRILYALFPSWYESQNDITSEAFTELSFQYADSAEHLLDLLYVSMELSKQGYTYYQVSQLRQWQAKILDCKPEASVQQIISYLFYAQCIEAEPEQLAEFVHAMPYYEQNALFSEILPAQRFPVGGIFVQQNTETILKQDSRLLKEYLSKIGKNNIWHFETDLDCPDAEPTSYLDYPELIKNIAWNHTAEEILYFYFNTHLRKILSPWKLYAAVDKILLKEDFDSALQNYIISGKITYDEEKEKQIFSTSQFYSDIEKLYIQSKEYHIFQWMKELNHAHLRIADGTLQQIADVQRENDGMYSGESYDCLEIMFTVSSQEEQKLLKKTEKETQKALLQMLDYIKNNQMQILDGSSAETPLEDTINNSLQALENIKKHHEKIINFLSSNLNYLKGKGNNDNILPFIQTWDFVSQNSESNQSALTFLTILANYLFLDADIDTEKYHNEIIKIFNIIIDNAKPWYGRTLISHKPFRTVVDITNAIKLVKTTHSRVSPSFQKILSTLNARLESLSEMIEIKSFLVSVEGKIKKITDEIFQFIPDNVISEKSPIFFINETSESLKEHTKYSGNISFYDVNHSCFIISNKLIETSLYKKVFPVIECLKKTVTDNTALLEISEYLDIPRDGFSRLDFNLQNCIITTISNRLKNNHPEQILPYLQTIKKINMYHYTNEINSSFFLSHPLILDEDNKAISENTIELIKNLTQQCSPETICSAYLNTELRCDVKLNILLKYANAFGKLPQVMKRLNFLSLPIYFSNFEEAIQNKTAINTPMIGNMTIEEFFKSPKNKENGGYFQFIDYDTNSDIVILKQISLEEAEENIKKLADTL